MANYKYVGEGTGAIHPVGVVYPGLVVDGSTVDPEVLNLSEDSRFEEVADDATSHTDILDVLNRAPSPEPITEAPESAGSPTAVTNPAPTQDPAPLTPAVIPTTEA